MPAKKKTKKVNKDMYSVSVLYKNGDSVEYEVKSQRILTNLNILRLTLFNDNIEWIILSNVLSISFDERFKLGE